MNENLKVYVRACVRMFVRVCILLPMAGCVCVCNRLRTDGNHKTIQLWVGVCSAHKRSNFVSNWRRRLLSNFMLRALEPWSLVGCLRNLATVLLCVWLHFGILILVFPYQHQSSSSSSLFRFFPSLAHTHTGSHMRHFGNRQPNFSPRFLSQLLLPPPLFFLAVHHFTNIIRIIIFSSSLFRLHLLLSSFACQHLLRVWKGGRAGGGDVSVGGDSV